MEEKNEVIYELQEDNSNKELQSAETPAQQSESASGQHAHENLQESASGQHAHENLQESENREIVTECDEQTTANETEKTPFEKEIESLRSNMTDEEILILIQKGKSHDEDVAQAEMKGELAGRNLKIEQFLDSISADNKPGRTMTSGHSITSNVRSIFDLADMA